MKSNFLFISALIPIVFSLISCSFVEPIPGDHFIIQVNPAPGALEDTLNSDSCKRLKEKTFETITTTFFIERSPIAIAKELQTLARNEAILSYANAIWPMTEVKKGKQKFLILRCTQN